MLTNDIKVCDEMEKRELFDSSYDDELYNQCVMVETTLIQQQVGRGIKQGIITNENKVTKKAKLNEGASTSSIETNDIDNNKVECDTCHVYIAKRLSKYETYSGSNCAQVFMNRLCEDVKTIVKKNSFQKCPVPLSDEDKIKISNSTICYICETELNEDLFYDFDWHTGSFRGVAHQVCSSKYRTPRHIPIFLHNLSHYDAHFIVHALNFDDNKVEVIPQNKERYISFSKQLTINNQPVSLRFVDSLKFLSCSLDQLAKNLNDDQFTELKRNYPNNEDFSRLRRKVKEICTCDFNQITWCFDEMQPLYNLPNVNYHQGIPNLNMFDGENPHLIIIDDLMRESDGRIVDIFTKGSHHRNLSVFYLTQNLFHQGKGQRDISLNSSYIIYFKNPRDKTQIRYLARQVSPDNTKFIEDAYRDATLEAHGYLMIDLKQNTNDFCRIKTNIFPFNGYCTVYVPTKEFKYTRNQTIQIISK
ncbi:hypothetical protein HF086_003506 [Spodoptera exigua]|uniref:DNA-directed DNA polymerase n=1 Tax=Spodoptera exigua TaxID=7107 RepID=A0A922MUZ3_SPOEX|nr:hypothetical protein HF086_003506 [Spodoptera exigua]